MIYSPELAKLLQGPIKRAVGAVLGHPVQAAAVGAALVALPLLVALGSPAAAVGAATVPAVVAESGAIAGAVNEVASGAVDLRAMIRASDETERAIADRMRPIVRRAKEELDKVIENGGLLEKAGLPAAPATTPPSAGFTGELSKLEQ